MFNAKAKAKTIGLSIFGGLAILAINVLATKAAAPKVAQYVVAATKIAPGVHLVDQDLKLQSVKGQIPAGAFTDLKTPQGKELNVTAVKGEPIIQSMVSTQAQRQSLPQGYAAYWVTTATEKTGYLSVGDVVNIYNNKGVQSIPGGYRVIGAVDNQGKPIQSGNAAAVEIAVPQTNIPELISLAGNIYLVLNPWANLGQGVITNDQTNMGYSGGSTGRPVVPGVSGVPSKGTQPGTGPSR
ncbi:hypothetical protein CEB3_c18620 [Peptococcaceae bacterium CEB3]|nr:hypothetical protein CEB3_c18620 [Peptococcaceae bacterium CEB3]